MSKIVSKLFLLSVIFLLFSCARPRVEMPSYEGVAVKDVLTAKNNISAIETTFSISFEKDDTEIRGDGVLNIAKNGDLSLRIYSFGFLAFEITSENGVIKSRPAVDRNKGTILTYGLRDCLFWWDLDNFETEEKEDVYILRDLNKTLWLDKKTMLPRKLTISLEEGRELNVSYENPEKTGDMWYPSKIRIELSKYVVTLKIRDISFALNTT